MEGDGDGPIAGLSRHINININIQQLIADLRKDVGSGFLEGARIIIAHPV